MRSQVPVTSVAGLSLWGSRFDLLLPQQFLHCFKQFFSLCSQSRTCHELNSFIPRLSPALETKIQVQIRLHYWGREFCCPCMSLGRWTHSLSSGISGEHSIWFIRSIIETDKTETNTCYTCSILTAELERKVNFVCSNTVLQMLGNPRIPSELSEWKIVPFSMTKVN